MKFVYEDSQLYYEKHGEGHPIIILHAMGTDHRSMKAWVEPIFKNIEGFQRIYVDIPAHGKSIIGKSLKSTQDFLEMILKFIESEVRYQSFSLVGHSYGGYLAQGILSAKKDLVKGLCLLAPALQIRERNLPSKVVRDVGKVDLHSLEPDIKSSVETLLVYQTKENIQKFLQEVQPGRLLANREFLISDWRREGYFLKRDPYENMSILSHPTLLLLGKQDSICGFSDYIPFLERFTNMSLCILNRAGHLMAIEKRKVVQALFKDWLITNLV